tara:strand:+ start:53 stop:745 length:693 start_codon:yes stop_codon:yes gene_type:complete
MAISTTGSVELNYGAERCREDFSYSLLALNATSSSQPDEYKSWQKSQRRVLFAGHLLDVGDIPVNETTTSLNKIGGILIKNMCDYGHLEVDLDNGATLSTFGTDLKIPPGGANLINPVVASTKYPAVRAEFGQLTGAKVATIASNGNITFNASSGQAVSSPCQGIIVKTGGGGVGTENTNHYVVKVSAAHTGVVYELDGTTTVDLTATYTTDSLVNIIPFIDYRYIVTER